MHMNLFRCVAIAAGRVRSTLFPHCDSLLCWCCCFVAQVEKRDVLRRSLSALDENELRFLVTRQLRLVAEDDPWAQDPAFLMEVGQRGLGRVFW